MKARRQRALIWAGQLLLIFGASDPGGCLGRARALGAAVVGYERPTRAVGVLSQECPAVCLRIDGTAASRLNGPGRSLSTRSIRDISSEPARALLFITWDLLPTICLTLSITTRKWLPLLATRHAWGSTKSDSCSAVIRGILTGEPARTWNRVCPIPGKRRVYAIE